MQVIYTYIIIYRALTVNWTTFWPRCRFN